LFQKRFFACFSKIFRKFYPLFYVKKTIKECPVPLDISIKSNRKHHKTVLYRKTNKNMFGQLFGRFFIVFGRFFNKNIWSPWLAVWYFGQKKKQLATPEINSWIFFSLVLGTEEETRNKK